MKTQGLDAFGRKCSAHSDNTGNVENEEKFVATSTAATTTSWFCFSLYNYIAFGGFELCYTFVIVLEGISHCWNDLSE